MFRYDIQMRWKDTKNYSDEKSDVVPRNVHPLSRNCHFLVEFLWFLINCIENLSNSLFRGRRLNLVVLHSLFKIEEFLHKMAISLKSGQVKQNNQSPLQTDLIEHSVLSICDDSWVFCLYISVSLPPFHCALWSARGLLRKLLDSPTLCLILSRSFSHSASLFLLYLYLLLSKTRLQKPFSLNAGALSLRHSLP